MQRLSASGIQRPLASGDILLGERRLNGMNPEDRRLGLLFQDDLLFPHLSVADNLAFGMRRGAVRRVERRQRIAESLASLGLQGFEPRDPLTLSGGERARVALLRVLLSGPSAVLLDEPFSRLDASTPASLVLLPPESGHCRYRQQTPYGDYDQSNRLMFPVSHRNRALPPKKWSSGSISASIPSPCRRRH